MWLGVAMMALAAAAVAGVVAPLLRSGRSVPGRGAFDRAVYRQQLSELEEDAARGLIDRPEAATARLEIERRLLAAAGQDEPATKRAATPALAVALALVVPMAAMILYLAVGSPGFADQPRTAAEKAPPAADTPPGHDDFTAGAAKLEQQLASNPADPEKWLLLARTEAELGRWQKSVGAYERVVALTGDSSDFAAAYGEMLVMAADGIVTPAARQQFAAALKRDSTDVTARFYTALAALQAGHAETAITQWQALAADVPEETIRAELRRRIEEAAETAGIPAPPLAPARVAGPAATSPPAGDAVAASGPTAADMAAAGAMSDSDRQTMIRSMVERLATRLESTPDDLDGWLRLARAYGVLGERDKARAAYERAQSLLPADSDQRPSIAAAIAVLQAQ